MTKINLNKEIADNLARNLPKSHLPSYISVTQYGISLLKTPTLWQTYNDITASIWHSPKGTITYRQTLYNKLHDIIIPAVEEAIE